MISFEKGLHAKSICEALKPETRNPATPRANVQVIRRGKTIKLLFRAADTTALRASMNSYLRFVSAWRGVVEGLRGLGAAKSYEDSS